MPVLGLTDEKCKSKAQAATHPITKEPLQPQQMYLNFDKPIRRKNFELIVLHSTDEQR